LFFLVDFKDFLFFFVGGVSTGEILCDWVKLSAYTTAIAHLHKVFYTHALVATAKCNDRSAFETLLLESGQLTRGDVNDLVKYFAHGLQVDDILIQFLANTHHVDEDNSSTPLLETPNNSPLMGDRRGFTIGHRRTVNSLSYKSASPSSSSPRLAYISPSFGAPSQSQLVRQNSHLPASPLLTLAFADSRTEEHQSSDGECD
jgi:hypothetical protein